MESAFRSIWTQLLLLFVVLALSVGAFAQGGTSELTGLITDPTGAVVAGVNVKLTNTATGQVRTTTTTGAGTYRFPALEVVGTYTLEVGAKGFKSVKVQNIVPAVGLVVTRDVKLELGAASEQVTVEAGLQLVQTEDASLGQQVDRRVWQDMPLELRSSNDFVALLPGAEPAALAQVSYDRGPAVNGARPGTGNYMVDGFNNNDQGQGGASTVYGTGGSVTTISPDAIQEYRVIDGTPPAEYGKSGGYVTDTVLKSGTNTWHGSLFEYNRVQALAANSFFSNFAGIQDRLTRNQFGGSVGGPIVKDKTFFYFTMEAHRLRTASPLSANTTTTDFLDFVNTGKFASFQESDPNGVCMQFTGSACPGMFSTSAPIASNATLGAQFTKMQAAEGLPFCTSGQANCANFSNIGQGLYTSGLNYPVPVYATINVPQPSPTNQMRYAAKVDHKIGTNDQLSGSYLYDNADSNVAFGGNNAMGPNLPVHGRSQNAGISWSHTFSPTILNQARFSYVRHTGNFPGDPRVSGFPDVLSALDSPNIGYGNADNLPQFFTENEFIWKDDVSITKGKHNIKTGAEFSRTRNGSSFDVEKNGYVYPMDIEDLVTDASFTNNLEYGLVGSQVFGSLLEAGASINPYTGQLPVYYRGFRANEAAAYVQDDWRIHPRLTLNVGVRWEYFGPPHNYQQYLDSNFSIGSTNVPITNPGTNPFYPTNNPWYAGIATGRFQIKNNLWQKDLDNWSPRLGFSYDALGNQKVVVRGGFGISYDRTYNNIFENIRLNPPYFALALQGSSLIGFSNIDPTATAELYQAPFTGTQPVFCPALPCPTLTPSTRAMAQNLETAYYEQAHFGVQYELAKDFVFESNYVGTFGRKLLAILGAGTYDGRTVSGYSHSLVNPNYGRISYRDNCCTSNYHGLQTSLRKRFSSGLQFSANYTYAKVLDDVSDTLAEKIGGTAHGYPMDPTNPKADYGPADFDVRHRIVADFVYDLPFAKSSRWIGGWNLAGIVSWQTGAPFSVYSSSTDSNKDGELTDRSSYIGPGKITNAYITSGEPWRGYLNPADFAQANTAALPCPASVNMGLWCEGPSVGQMGRNTLNGPHYFNTDFSVKKGFKLTERAKLEFQANFFNIWNHPNFLIPDNNIVDATLGKSLGTFNNTQSGGPRITQLALRLDF